jgi:hypothetical protein
VPGHEREDKATRTTYISRRSLLVSRNRRGRGSNPSALFFSSLISACSFSTIRSVDGAQLKTRRVSGMGIRGVRVGVSAVYNPPGASQSGATTRHLRFFFSDKASQRGTEAAEGGVNGP